MRAIVCETLGTPDTLVVHTDWPEPEPKPGEIKVRLLARAVQYVDVLMVAGQYQTKPPVPFIPGGEAAGEIVALGEGVTGFAVGDMVMSRHTPCGAFADYGVSPADQTMHIPKGMPVEAAAGFRSAYATAYHALVQRGRLQAGETLLIHGAAGGIGLAAVQVGKALGATVIGAASTEEKRAVVLANGADHVIDYEPVTDGRGTFREKVKELTGGKGADVVYDPVGDWVFEESMRCINWGARILILGFLGGSPALARTNHLLIKGASAVGVRLGGFVDNEPDVAAANLRALVDLAEKGLLKPHVSHTLPLERAAEALQLLVDRRVIGKAVLV